MIAEYHSDCDQQDNTELLADLLENGEDDDLQSFQSTSKTSTLSSQFSIKRLPQLKSNIFSTILQDVINKIIILNKNKITVSGSSESVKKKLHSSDDYKLIKLKNDRVLGLEIIVKTFLDLRINNSFETLIKYLADVGAKQYQILSLELQYKNDEKKLETLKSELIVKREGYENAIKDSEIKIYMLRDKIENYKKNIEVGLTLAVQNERERSDNNILRKTKKENKHSVNIDNNLRKIKEEQRVNEEIGTFIYKQIKELKYKINFWNEKYQSDSKRIDNEISLYTDKQSEQKESYVKLEATFNNHAEEIEKWMKIIEERRKRSEYESLLHRSATILQAWWRGVLVRRRLAFKQTKDAKGKAVKKKK